MDLTERARITHDQMQINRVAQAVIAVALEHRNHKRILVDPQPAAQRAIYILSSGDDGWVGNDDALLAGVRAAWKKIRR